MSDEVGVDPDRLIRAALALQNLRDVLAANVPAIVNTMNLYWSGGTGSPIDLSVLQQAQARSVDDAQDMQNRSTLAYLWQQQRLHLSGNMVDIPWNSQEASKEAKIAERAEYQDGVRLAKSLDGTGNYAGAAWLLAEHPGDPYFTAGLLNNLNADQIIAIMTWPNSAFPPPSGTDQAIVTAMADGTLSSATMRNLVTWLTSMDANAGGNQFMTNPLLQEIAENRDASARLLAFMDPDPQAQGSVQIKDLLKAYADTGAENSVVQIMANAVYAAPPQQAKALIKSLVADLLVLDSSTISLSSAGLTAFMQAAAFRLEPADPSPAQLGNLELLDNTWINPYLNNLGVLTALLDHIGQAFQGHADEVIFWRGFYEGLLVGIAIAALPLTAEDIVGALGIDVEAGDLGLAGRIALGGAESAGSSELQKYLDYGAKYLFPAGESGGAAQVQAWQKEKMIVIVAGVMQIGNAAGDEAQVDSLLQNPQFYQNVRIYAAGAEGNPGFLAASDWLGSQHLTLGGQSVPLEQIVGPLSNLGIGNPP
jgi:hypothetical protein